MQTFRTLWVFIFMAIMAPLTARDGYKLWMDYQPLEGQQLQKCRQFLKGYCVAGDSPTMEVVRRELRTGLQAILGSGIREEKDPGGGFLVVAGVTGTSVTEAAGIKPEMLKETGREGYLIRTVRVKKRPVTVITANSETGVLYGTYRFLALLRTGADPGSLDLVSSPKIKLRILNHWDNLNGSIERGYAGQSLWNWADLPGKTDPRYEDYARACASVGINATVLNNVNANPAMLTKEYLAKVAALAAIFRPYGLRVFLSVKFSSPVNIGGHTTADPLDPAVIDWWKKKTGEIYSLIPDFGGFLVKANSEGQPGPQNYGRSHAEGANMLAEALKPHGGIVMWRAFVYDNNVPDDRAKQALNEFKPLDGQFLDNVLIQVKNGPVDFQPREPFHPLFGAMPGTPLMMEFQVTQEYLGQSTDLCYLAPLFKECLDADTYAKGAGSTVAKVIDGSLENHRLTGMAGVANTGNDRNWTGHLFGQANWYSFGRLAWDPAISAGEMSEEWIRLTLSSDPKVVGTLKKIMMESRENSVNYMTPLGLHHIMGNGHHFGPGPWVNRGRADWTAVYYHKADSAGVGFDRSPTGSNATGQYAGPVAKWFADLSTCPDEYLLWFHHLPWNYRMRSGKTLWDELCVRYSAGVNGVRAMCAEWKTLEGKIDPELFGQVSGKMAKQEKLAEWWRNSCLLYFQQFSRMAIPADLEQPSETLDYYKKFNFSELK